MFLTDSCVVAQCDFCATKAFLPSRHIPPGWFELAAEVEGDPYALVCKECVVVSVRARLKRLDSGWRSYLEGKFPKTLTISPDKTNANFPIVTP